MNKHIQDNFSQLRNYANNFYLMRFGTFPLRKILLEKIIFKNHVNLCYSKNFFKAKIFGFGYFFLILAQLLDNWFKTNKSNNLFITFESINIANFLKEAGCQYEVNTGNRCENFYPFFKDGIKIANKNFINFFLILNMIERV